MKLTPALSPSRLAALAASLMLLLAVGFTATPARGEVPLPEGAINDQTVGVFYFDVSMWDRASIDASIDAMIAILPQQMQEQARGREAQAEMDEGLTKFENFRSQFARAGGQGFMLGLLSDGSLETEPEAYLLLKVEPGTDPAAIKAALASMSDDPSEMDEVTLSPYADGWMSIDDGSQDLVAAPTNGTAAAMEKVQNMVQGSSDAAMTAIIVNDETVTALLNSASQEFRREAGGEEIGQRFVAPMTGLLQALTQSDGSVGQLTLGRAPSLAKTIMFPDAAGAQAAMRSYDSLLDTTNRTLAEAIGQMQAQGQQVPVNARQVSTVVEALRMEQNGSNLSLTITPRTLGTMTPIAEAYMQMMGGGMGDEDVMIEEDVEFEDDFGEEGMLEEEPMEEVEEMEMEPAMY